jgi:hypothetical protein
MQMSFYSFLFNRYSFVLFLIILIGTAYWFVTINDCIVGYRLYEKANPENFESLQKAIKHDPSLVNRKFSLGEDNVSLVHMACSNCNLEVINFLISLNADFSQETSEGRTPLSILTTRSDPIALECIRAILGSKSIEKSAIIQPNRFGKSPISIAISHYMPVYLKEYFKLSHHIENYQYASNMVKNYIQHLVMDIIRMKKDGLEFNDIQDHPMVKRHLDKLEEFI